MSRNTNSSTAAATAATIPTSVLLGNTNLYTLTNRHAATMGAARDFGYVSAAPTTTASSVLTSSSALGASVAAELNTTTRYGHRREAASSANASGNNNKASAATNDDHFSATSLLMPRLVDLTNASEVTSVLPPHSSSSLLSTSATAASVTSALKLLDQIDALEAFTNSCINDIRSFYSFAPMGRKRTRVVSDADRLLAASSAANPFVLSKRALINEFTLSGGPSATAGVGAVDTLLTTHVGGGDASVSSDHLLSSSLTVTPAASSAAAAYASSTAANTANATLACEVAKTLPITCPDTVSAIGVQKIAADLAMYGALCTVGRRQPYAGRAYVVGAEEGVEGIVPPIVGGVAGLDAFVAASSEKPAPTTTTTTGRKRGGGGN